MRTDQWMRALTLVAALGLALTQAQTYVFQRTDDIRTLDPIEVSENISKSVVENVYEGLYGYHGASVELEPRLATSYEVSDDGQTYTFHLRQGVRFHSGNPFTCSDAEYSLKRALVIYPGILAEAVFAPGTQGAYQFDDGTPDAEYQNYWDSIERSVECSDDSTLVFRTRDPDPILIARLATTPFSMIDSVWAKANGMWDGSEATWRRWIDEDLSTHHLHDHASGTGAFKVVGWEPGVRVTAERNADYWGPAPQLERVVYEVVPDGAARIAALQAGEADQIDLPSDAITRTELAALPGVKLLDPRQDPSLPWGLTSVWAILFNYSIEDEGTSYIGSGKLDGQGVPPDFFTDRDVRKCFAYSFDPEAYNQEAWEGTGILITMALLPEFDGYDASIPSYGLDPAKAEEHCRAAWGGKVWENGFRLALPLVPDHSLAAPVLRQFKKNLEALNPKFAVDLVEIDWDELFDASDELRLPLDVLGDTISLPDSAGFMISWYQSGLSAPGYYGYRNDEIDALIEGARTEFDAAKRAEAYRQVGRIGYDDAAFVLIPNAPYVMTVSDKVSGAYRNPVRVEVQWKDLTKAP